MSRPAILTGVDPSTWSTIVPAVAALAGVAVGQILSGRNALRQSKIAREDEYRAEVRAAASLLVSAVRQFQDSATASLHAVLIAILRSMSQAASDSHHYQAFGMRSTHRRQQASN